MAYYKINFQPPAKIKAGGISNREKIPNFNDVDPNRRKGLTRKRKTNQTEQQLRKIGLNKLKTGTHTQMWRVDAITGARQKVEGDFARLGAMGELGQDIVTFCTIDQGILNQYNSVGMNLSYSDLELKVNSLLLTPVINYLKKKIDIWVPVETYALRNSIKSTLTSSYSSIVHSPFRLIIGTPGIPYASVVNKMPTSSLRKSGKAPQARHGFYNLLLLNSRPIADRSFKNLVRATAALIPVQIAKKYFRKRNRYNIARSLFGFAVI